MQQPTQKELPKPLEQLLKSNVQLKLTGNVQLELFGQASGLRVISNLGDGETYHIGPLFDEERLGFSYILEPAEYVLGCHFRDPKLRGIHEMIFGKKGHVSFRLELHEENFTMAEKPGMIVEEVLWEDYSKRLPY